MNLNLGSVSGNTLELGYTGAFTGGGVTYPYALTAHGTPHPNSIMAGNTFDTTGTVELRIITDADPSIVVVDWQAMSDNQEWLTDIDAASSVTTVSAGTATITIGWRVVADGSTGTFERTIAVTEPVADTDPAPFTVTPLTDQPLNEFVEFAPITVADIDAGEEIAVVVTGTDVEYAVDTGSGYAAFTSVSTNVQVGHLVKPRIRTSVQFSTAATGSIAIGSESSSLSATTEADAEPMVPQGVISALFPVTTQTEATITFSYIESDATGFEYSTNGATWIATTSPLTLTGLSPSTTDSVQLRAINDAGPGEALTVNYRTKGEPVVVPEGDWPFFTPTTTAAKTWEWSGRHPKTGMRVRVFIEIP